MTSALIDRYFLYQNPSRCRRVDIAAKHDAQISSAAPSPKRALKLKIERHSESRPDGLAAILIYDTMFAGTDDFRHDEMKMHMVVKIGSGSDLNQDLLKFVDLEVEHRSDHMLCHQRQYLEQKVSNSRLPVGTAMSKTLVKKAADTEEWVATINCPHVSFLVSS